ncbi:cyclin-like protein [Dichotomocladium elegans]|nr:cyclin-like protein [Dichotomocladium elegans]
MGTSGEYIKYQCFRGSSSSFFSFFFFLFPPPFRLSMLYTQSVAIQRSITPPTPSTASTHASSTTSSSSTRSTGIIPPGFINFASASFNAIFYEHPCISDLDNSQFVNDEIRTSPKRRPSHLPDLLPFIQLVIEKCNVHPVQLVVALIYVQRFRATFPEGYRPEPQAAHRIFAASLLVASKFSEDYCLSTKQLVRATGDVWSIKEMTRMELAFLRFLDWNLHVSETEIASFLRGLHFDADTIMPPAASANDTAAPAC